MTQSGTPPPSAPVPTREEIADAAKDVTAAAQELGKSIEAIENFLESRNIGVSAWVRVKGWENPGADYWTREVGYTLLPDSDEWRIAIRETSGHDLWPEQSKRKEWAFNKAPRKTRISCAPKIPDLLHQLIKEATRTARRLRETTAEVNAFAATLSIPIPAPKAKK